MRHPLSKMKLFGALTRMAAWLSLLTIPLLGPRRAGANEIRVLDSPSSAMVVELITSDYQLHSFTEGEQEYIRLEAPGYGYLERQGHPLLPIRGFLVGLPPEGQISVSILEQEWTSVQTGLLCPAPGLREEHLSENRPVSWSFTPSDFIYEQDIFYPTSLFEVELLGLFRDQRVARVQVHPFRFNPVRRQLDICRRLVLEILFPPEQSFPEGELFFHPTSPRAEEILSSVLLNYQQARSWRLNRENPSHPKGTEKTAPTCKITVSEDGLYSIGRSELLEAQLDLATIDPRTFQMSNKGTWVPIYVTGEKDGSFDEGDVIEFFGQENWSRAVEEHPDMVQDPYDSRNVYWLSWGQGPGVRMVEEDAGLKSTGPQKPVSYTHTIHAEENTYRDHLNNQSQLRDHWFWGSGISAGGMKSYTLDLPHPDRGSPLRPNVRVMLHGLTSVEDCQPDHHVLIYLNDHLVADRTWDGQDLLLVDSAEGGFDLTSSAIENEQNTLTLICPGDTPAKAIDVILLNWIQVSYPRLFQADDDQLKFSKPAKSPLGLYQFTLQGFSQSPVWVYKLGSSVMLNGQGEWARIDGTLQYQLTFQDEIYDDQTEYLAVTSGAKKKVEAIELRSIPSLLVPDRGADMVIIVHEDFYDGVLPLAEFRRDQGLQVEVVKVAEIYDQFSHGLFSPEAIRNFLIYAYHHWDPAPLFVLLVGDGSWDYYDVLDLGQNYIPPIMTQTSVWGATPCDNLYACVSGDDQLPDLFVGRFPVQTNKQLAAIVNKIISTESAPELGDWRRRILFICGSGGEGALFRSQSENLIANNVTPDFLVSRVYAYSTNPAVDPYFGGTQDLIDALDEGVSLANFIGHGGGGIWSDAGLMRLEDVSRLRPTQRWPMVASMTCFTAAFDEPKRDCLGERLLLAEDKGVVGFWGASGLGWLYGDYYLDEQLMKAIFSKGQRIFGQAVTEAKLQYMANYGGQIAQDLVNEYLLLGDPASRIGFPQKEVRLTLWPEAVNPGDTVHLAGSIDQVVGGQARLTILDGTGATQWESILTVAGGAFQATVPLPQAASPGIASARCYFWDSQNLADGAGSANFSIGQAHFDTIFTEPTQPASGQAVHVWAKVSSAQGIDSLSCHWKMSLLDSTEVMIPQGDPGQYRTLAPISSAVVGVTVRFWIIAVDSAGVRSTSPQQTYRIPSLADLQVSASDIVLATDDQVGIALTVHNYGETRADSVLVRVSITSAQKTRAAKEALIDAIWPASRETIFLPWDLPSGSYQVLAQADPENVLAEGNEFNNQATDSIAVQIFNVTPQEGTVVDGQHAPVYSLDGNLSCDIPASVFDRQQVIRIEPTIPRIDSQPDMAPVRLHSGEHLAYNLTLVDSTASVRNTSEILLTFQLDDQDSLTSGRLDEVALYRWNETIGRWIRHGRIIAIAPNAIVAAVSGLGQFCPLVNADQTPPTIEINVEDQYFSEGALVSSNAKIVAVIHDANGVDSQERAIQVQYDGQTVPAEQIAFLPSPDHNHLPVSFAPRLTSGQHTTSFSAYDCSGNLATKSISFQVIDSYGIDQMGNYPNPMDEETVFTYRLTGPNHAEEIYLKIYTVSGRLIRSFHDFLDDFGRPGTQLDYHVLSWDGRDDDGHRLANGVYFYKIRAKWENQSAEQSGKLAILR